MDCFDRILEFYEKKEFFNSLQGRIWLDLIVVKLMKELEESPMSNDRIRNCLIFLLNLCFGIEYPDHYHTKGKSSKELTEKERKQLSDLLRVELNGLNN